MEEEGSSSHFREGREGRDGDIYRQGRGREGETGSVCEGGSERESSCSNVALQQNTTQRGSRLTYPHTGPQPPSALQATTANPRGTNDDGCCPHREREGERKAEMNQAKPTAKPRLSASPCQPTTLLLESYSPPHCLCLHLPVSHAVSLTSLSCINSEQ